MNLMSIFKAVLLTVTFVVILTPFIFWSGGKQFAAQLNNTGINITHNANYYIFNQVNKTAYNATGGFNAQITVPGFSGLAFVFDGINIVMKSLVNLPYEGEMLVAVPVSRIGIPVYEVQTLVGILFAFIAFVITMIGISAWMKYSLLEQE